MLIYADEIQQAAKEEFYPGKEFAYDEVDGNGNSHVNTYRVVAVYPHIVLGAKEVKGRRLYRGFTHWEALKAIGKIQPVTLLEFNRGEKRKDGTETRTRDLLNEKRFLDVCEAYSKGEIKSQKKAASMCDVSHYTFSKYYKKYMAGKN